MSKIEEKKGPLIGVRHLQVFLLFFTIVINFVQRLNVSLSIVAMTDASTTNPDFDEYNWSEKQKSYILSSFYWGYVITQYPGGYMARKFGVKIVILVTILGSSILCLIIPWCVPWGGWKIYCAIRVGQGLLQGTIFPCVHEHLANWSPFEERTKLGGLACSGVEFGSVISMALTGTIAGSNLGWPAISFFFGGTGFIFCACWMIFAINKPLEARWITPQERSYILSSQSKHASEKVIPIPWKAILTSVPFISLALTRMGQSVGFGTLQAQIPKYMHGVLAMNIQKNSLYSALPYIAMFFFCIFFTYVADFVLRKKIATLSVVRKTLNSISMFIPAALMIASGFLDEKQKVLAITLMTLNVGINAAQSTGSFLNGIDLSPNHAAILVGITNTLSNIIPIVSPIAVGFIVSDETDRSQWQTIFLIAAVPLVILGAQFIFFGSADTQPWNDEDFLLKGDIEQKFVPKTEKQIFLKPKDSLEQNTIE